jgi:hypothetical protein
LLNLCVRACDNSLTFFTRLLFCFVNYLSRAFISLVYNSGSA